MKLGKQKRRAEMTVNDHTLRNECFLEAIFGKINKTNIYFLYFGMLFQQVYIKIAFRAKRYICQWILINFYGF